MTSEGVVSGTKPTTSDHYASAPPDQRQRAKRDDPFVRTPTLEKEERTKMVKKVLSVEMAIGWQPTMTIMMEMCVRMCRHGRLVM